VEIRAKDVATVTSFRMPPGELEQIRIAAKAEGTTMSEWIRNACKAALGRPAPTPDRAHIIELLDVLRRTVEEADRTLRGQLDQSPTSSTLTAEPTGGRRPPLKVVEMILTSNPDPKLWERGGRIQFDKDWEAKAIEKLCASDHSSALAARDAVRQYIATSSGRRAGNVPMSEVLDLLRSKARGRAVLIREGVVPATLLEQLARLLRRGRRIRIGSVRLPP
jgi:hypothetical protein